MEKGPFRAIQGHCHAGKSSAVALSFFANFCGLINELMSIGSTTISCQEQIQMWQFMKP